MTTILRPLSTSEILDRTFYLYKNNFLVFLAIAAIPRLVLFLVQFTFARLVIGNTMRGLALSIIPISIASTVCLGISHGATVYAVSNLHLNRPARIADSFGAIAGSIGRIIWVSLAFSFIVGFGFLFFIVPGVYWTLKYSLVIPVAVLERASLSESLRRSGELTENSRTRIFVSYVLFFVLGWVASECVRYPLGVGPHFGTHARVLMTSTRFTLLSLAGFVANSLVGPLLTITLTLIYYDERVRREGFDLQLMMSTLENLPEPAAEPAL